MTTNYEEAVAITKELYAAGHSFAGDLRKIDPMREVEVLLAHSPEALKKTIYWTNGTVSRYAAYLAADPVLNFRRLPVIAAYAADLTGLPVTEETLKETIEGMEPEEALQVYDYAKALMIRDDYPDFEEWAAHNALNPRQTDLGEENNQ